MRDNQGKAGDRRSGFNVSPRNQELKTRWMGLDYIVQYTCFVAPRQADLDHLNISSIARRSAACKSSAVYCAALYADIDVTENSCTIGAGKNAIPLTQTTSITEPLIYFWRCLRSILLMKK